MQWMPETEDGVYICMCHTQYKWRNCVFFSYSMKWAVPVMIVKSLIVPRIETSGETVERKHQALSSYLLHLCSIFQTALMPIADALTLFFCFDFICLKNFLCHIQRQLTNKKLWKIGMGFMHKIANIHNSTKKIKDFEFKA